MAGWYLPVLVVGEEQMKERGGVSVVAMVKRVAVGRAAGGIGQAVGISMASGAGRNGTDTAHTLVFPKFMNLEKARVVAATTLCKQAGVATTGVSLIQGPTLSMTPMKFSPAKPKTPMILSRAKSKTPA